MRAITGRGSERGSTMVMVAVSLAALLSMGALAVDLAMLMKVRNDAQRTADAAALAGASTYLTQLALDARDSARIRAFEYAAKNYVGGTFVDTANQVLTVSGNNWTITSNEATVEIAPDIYRVRVTVRRPAVGLLFGRVFGPNTTPIAAYAAAEATNAGGAKCVKPFALADPWDDADNDTDGNDFWDAGEEWNYDPAQGDYYQPWDGFESEPSTPYETGWGSILRDDNSSYHRDYGRQLVLKPQNPLVDQMINPGHFFAWDMPEDPTQTTNCGVGGGGGGASAYSQNICSCNNTEVYTETPYPIKTGNMVNPTKVGIQDLVALDELASWDPAADGGRGAVTGWNQQLYGNNWRNSPRVIKVGLYDPDQAYKSGKIDIEFTNIGLLFLEAYVRVPGNGDGDYVTARFITFAEGSGPPGPGGPLAKVLRLVE